MGDSCAPDKRHQFVHDGRVVYEWDQTLSDVNLYVVVPPGIRAKELFCDIEPQAIKLGIKGNPPYLQGPLAESVKVSQSFWTLEDGVLTINMQKAKPGEPWPSVIAGHELNAVQQDEETQRLMRERFQKEHPGFDFSGATFNGQVPNPRTFMGGTNVQYESASYPPVSCKPHFPQISTV